MVNKVFFGPCTIQFDAVDLGKTVNGVSININEHDEVVECINETFNINYISAVTGVIHKFEIEDLGVFDTLVKNNTPGILTFNGSSFIVTITNAYLKFPSSFSIGVNNLNPFDLRFFAGRDDSIHSDANPIIKIETV